MLFVFGGEFYIGVGMCIVSSIVFVVGDVVDSCVGIGFGIVFGFGCGDCVGVGGGCVYIGVLECFVCNVSLF